MNVPSIRPVVRGWALIDVMVTLPLLLPMSAQIYIGMTFRVQTWLGVPLPAEPASLSALTLLFASLTGLLGLLWALARWSTPSPRIAGIDVLGRVWVGALLVYFMVSSQIPLTFWLFVGIEWIGALHQAARLLQSRSRRA